MLFHESIYTEKVKRQPIQKIYETLKKVWKPRFILLNITIWYMH